MTAHIYRIAVDIFHSRSIFGRFKILKNNMARCSVFYGGVWEICCLSGCGVLLPTFFMSKSSVADLRRILSRIFEHQCHKDQTGQQLFVRVEQKIIQQLILFPMALHYHRLLSLLLLPPVCHLGFCMQKIYTILNLVQSSSTTLCQFEQLEQKV